MVMRRNYSADFKSTAPVASVGDESRAEAQDRQDVKQQFVEAETIAALQLAKTSV